MLGNNPRVKGVENLRDILLKEADFKFVNKLLIVFNIMKAAKAGLIPLDKYIGRKIQFIVEAGLNKYFSASVG